jgi:methionine-rich copper-binding protein CopC
MRLALWPACNFYILATFWIAPSSSAEQIDIINGLVSPGPERNAAGSEFELAFDGDINTRTFTTSSGTTAAPQRSLLAFEEGISHNLTRIRINDIAGNDNNGRMQQITVRVTTDTDTDLNARNYLAVTNLSVEKLEGDADTLPNLVITDNTIEHLDTDHDGFYSIVFDSVPSATGIELEWANEGQNKHWTIREIEAYSSGDEPELLVSEAIAIEVNGSGTVPVPVRNGSQAQDLEISAVEITGGPQAKAFSNVQFPKTLAPRESGVIDLEFDNDNNFAEFEAILTISSNDPDDPEREITVIVTAKPPPITPTDTLINIVNGIVDPGPERTAAGSEFELAFDGDINTRTFTTNSGTTTTPQRSLLAFEEGTSHDLTRIRINDVAGNDTNGRMQQITVRVTTDSDPVLTERTYADVINLFVILFEGDTDPIPNTDIIGNTIEHLDTVHDGFYSLVFNTVPGATGIEFEWANEGQFKHWTIREIEAYSVGPKSFEIVEFSVNGDGKPVITWKSRQNIVYAIDFSYDLNEWMEITDDLTGQANTTPFVHEDFEEGTERIFYRLRTP